MSIRSAVFKCCRLLPDPIFLQLVYYKHFKHFVNFKNPVTFTEKLQWLKLNYRKPEFTTMVDKYLVKDYVAGKIGREHIIPTIGVWDHPEEIDFDVLPDQFVLKWNHDSQSIVICRDKSKLDREEAIRKLKSGDKANGYWYGREWPYKNVKPHIIAEKYLENNEEGLHDYKVWCFHGEPKYVQYVTGRIQDKTYDTFFDRNWNNCHLSICNPPMQEDIAKPSGLDKMLELAHILSENLPFARVDFYILEDGTILFGEITFYPMAGFCPFHPKEQDEEFGKMIILPEVEK